MMKRPIILLVCFTMTLAFSAQSQQRERPAQPLMQWSFEAVPLNKPAENAVSDRYKGFFTEKSGVRGSCLNFDGFTTHVVGPPPEPSAFEQGLTIEAWIAPQEYSWAWTGIVDQAADTMQGFSFGINYLGQIGFQACVAGKWIAVESQAAVPLLRWSHVAVCHDPQSGIRIFIDGKEVAGREGKAKLIIPDQLSLILGKSQQKQFPALTERKTSMKFLSDMVFDGLIDEVKIYARPLSADDISRAFHAVQPAVPQPLHYRILPSGPQTLNTFGAFYTHLEYCPEWDRLWPVGDFADVVVGFDEIPVRMVFWRGTGYCPAWVTSNGKWVGDQGPESWNWDTFGCFEQMSDKQCRYSHVRILENSDARAVVHWRTASPAIDYSANHINPATGWSEWTDEYYYIYPDAVAVRYQEIHSGWAAEMEWQQSELINQPGTRPQDNVDLDAATILNMQGEAETWSWEQPYGRPAQGSTAIQEGMIQVINLKAEQKHFVIGEQGASWQPFTFGAREGFSTIPCWNHWPVAQLPNDGRVAPAADRPSSACFGTLYPVKHTTDLADKMIGRNLYGMTGKPVQELARLARSWNFPPELKLWSDEFANKGYDKNQRAYVVHQTSSAHQTTLRISLSGSEHSPIVNPAMVVENWGEAAVQLKMDGQEINKGKNFRCGYRRTIDGTDLILWIKTESESILNLQLEKSESGRPRM